MSSTAPDCLPPDPSPIAPGFVVPPGACDAHFHVFGPFDRYPLSPKRVFTPVEATYRDCIAMHDRLGIQRGVVVHSAANGLDMQVSYDAVVALGGRWRGIALATVDTPDRDFARWNEAGFRGVRLNFVDLGATAEEMKAMAARLAPFGWHLQLLVKLDRLRELAPVIRELPVPCVVDHMGFTRTDLGIGHPGFQALLALMREGRTWCKVSGSDRIGRPEDGYAAARPFMQALVDVGADRLVWGSDWPHVRKIPMPNDGFMLKLLGDGVPDAATRNRILVDNPARLYGFPPLP